MSELEQTATEAFARVITRRRFLNRAMRWSFAAVAGAATSGTLAGMARAHTANGQAYCANRWNSTTFCVGTLCAGQGLQCTGGGHDCPSGYWFDTHVHASACWCSGPNGQKYWICCDCTNGSNSCVCAQCVGSGCSQKPPEIASQKSGKAASQNPRRAPSQKPAKAT